MGGVKVWSLLVLTLALLVPGLAVAAEGEAVANPTFTKDVAPIFQQKCEACHRPGYIAPMSLVTYQDARPWARSIKNRVMDRRCPRGTSTRRSVSRSSRTIAR